MFKGILTFVICAIAYEILKRFYQWYLADELFFYEPGTHSYAWHQRMLKLVRKIDNAIRKMA